MPIGLDEASGVAGLIACSVTLLNGCIKGFVLLSRARTCDRRISTIDLNFELEQLKLCHWAEQAGLFETPAQLRFAPPIRECVQKVLSQLRELLGDVRQLKNVYRLDLVETSEEMTDVQSDESAFSHLQLGRVPEVQRVNDNVATVFCKSRKLSPWLRLRWVTVDEDRYRALLEDVSQLVGHLIQLPRLDGGRGLEGTFDTLYRTAIINNNNLYNLNLLIENCQDKSLTSIAAPARLKKKSILSGLFRRTRRNTLELESAQQLVRNDSNLSESSSFAKTTMDMTPTKPDVKRLRNHRLTLPDAIQAHSARQLAYYDDFPVLIEWRNVDGHNWKRMENRAGRFCDLLQEMALFPSFHSLPCLGFLKEGQTGRYGYVFELAPYSPSVPSNPYNTVRNRPPLPRVRTLRDMVGGTIPIPSLNVRLSYAIVLLETILQLHTAGWLHKELRSDNVLLVAQAGEEHLDCELLESPMYLAGYTYARADDPEDFTEIMRPADEADSYRHPLSLLGHDRRSYCRGFDVFSVGCILLELGMWSTLPHILCRQYRYQNFGGRSLTPPRSPQPSSSDLLGERSSTDLQCLRQQLLAEIRSHVAAPGGILNQLRAQVGKAFANVVAEFLNVRTVCGEKNSGFTDHRYILDLEKRALDQLRGLAERL